jgi:hypothetical protein
VSTGLSYFHQEFGEDGELETIARNIHENYITAGGDMGRNLECGEESGFHSRFYLAFSSRGLPLPFPGSRENERGAAYSGTG